MSYAAFDACPAWEHCTWVEGKPQPSQGLPRWAQGAPPPPIGAEILITMNRCGPAIVTGYFTEDDFLGVRCRLLDPPDWHKRQNKGDPNGHVFGTEFTDPKPEA